MLINFNMRHICRAALITATASLFLLAGPVKVEAAKPPPEPLSCSISPADGSTAAGVPITFTGDTQGARNVRIYSWDFSDGAGVPATSVENTVDVTYSTVGGPFAVLLAVEDKNGATASCSTTVTVTEPPPPSAGEALYQANCRMCHGIEAVGGFAQRDIRTAGATRIRGAITRRADMNFLGTRPNPITDAEIESIAAYLDTLPRGTDDIPRRGDLVVGEDQFRKSCTYCHSFGGTPIEPPRPGPDLMGVATNFSDAFLGAWIAFPNEMIDAGAYPGALEPYRMPDLGHSDINAWDIAQFLLEQDGMGPLVDSEPVVLTPEQFEASRQDYFNLCAGCHGLFRTGATGPDIGALRSQAIGTPAWATSARPVS